MRLPTCRAPKDGTVIETRLDKTGQKVDSTAYCPMIARSRSLRYRKPAAMEAPSDEGAKPNALRTNRATKLHRVAATLIKFLAGVIKRPVQ